MQTISVISKIIGALLVSPIMIMVLTMIIAFIYAWAKTKEDKKYDVKNDKETVRKMLYFSTFIVVFFWGIILLFFI